MKGLNIKNLIPVSLLIFSFFQNALPQDSENSDTINFIYTYSGNILRGQDIVIENVNDSYQFRIDSMVIDVSLIKFVSYKSVLWANTDHIRSRNQFIPGTFKGNINLFTDTEEVTENNYTGIHMSAGQIWGENIPANDKYEIEYYSKGFGDLKIANYRNLIYDLADNQQCVEMLYKSKNYRNRSSFFYIAGLATIIYGLTNSMSNDSQSKSVFSNKAISVAIPVTLGTGSFFIGRKFSNHSLKLKQEAIKSY